MTKIQDSWIFEPTAETIFNSDKILLEDVIVNKIPFS